MPTDRNPQVAVCTGIPCTTRCPRPWQRAHLHFPLNYLYAAALQAVASGKKKANLPAKAADVRDVGLISGSGRSPGGGHGNPLQYSCLENPLDRGAWRGYSPRGHRRVGHDWVTQHPHVQTHVLLSWPQSAHKFNCPLSQMAERHLTHQTQNLSQTPSSLTLTVRAWGSSGSLCVFQALVIPVSAERRSFQGWRDRTVNALCKGIPVFQSRKAVCKKIFFCLFWIWCLVCWLDLPGFNESSEVFNVIFNTENQSGETYEVEQKLFVFPWCFLLFLTHLRVLRVIRLPAVFWAEELLKFHILSGLFCSLKYIICLYILYIYAFVWWHHQLSGCWVWANSGRWWWTGRPGVLQSVGSQRVS